MRRIILSLLVLLGFACGANASVYVMTQGTDYTNNTIINGGLNKPFPMEQYKEALKSGSRCIAAAYTNLNGWVLSMAENTGIRLQHISMTAAWPEEWIQQEWNEGYQITSVAYGESQWLVITSLNCGLSQQIVKTGTVEELPAFIRENWSSSDRQVTAWCADKQPGRQGEWAVVMSVRDNNTPGQRYDFKGNWTKMEPIVETYLANDYFIECITYGSSNVGVMFNHGYGDGTTPHQVCLTDPIEVQEYIGKGYVVTAIANNL